MLGHVLGLFDGLIGVDANHLNTVLPILSSAKVGSQVNVVSGGKKLNEFSVLGLSKCRRNRPLLLKSH